MPDTLKEVFKSNEPLFTGLHILDGWDWSVRHPVSGALELNVMDPARRSRTAPWRTCIGTPSSRWRCWSTSTTSRILDAGHTGDRARQPRLPARAVRHYQAGRAFGRGIAELTATFGYYAMLAGTLNAFESRARGPRGALAVSRPAIQRYRAAQTLYKTYALPYAPILGDNV